MILTRDEIEDAVEKGEIKFDPPLEKRQWKDASVDLRLGYKFTKIKPSKLELSLAEGIGAIDDLWYEEKFPHFDNFGKERLIVSIQESLFSRKHLKR